MTDLTDLEIIAEVFEGEIEALAETSQNPAIVSWARRLIDVTKHSPDLMANPYNHDNPQHREAVKKWLKTLWGLPPKRIKQLLKDVKKIPKKQ